MEPTLLRTKASPGSVVGIVTLLGVLAFLAGWQFSAWLMIALLCAVAAAVAWFLLQAFDDSARVSAASAQALAARGLMRAQSDGRGPAPHYPGGSENPEPAMTPIQSSQPGAAVPLNPPVQSTLLPQAAQPVAHVPPVPPAQPAVVDQSTSKTSVFGTVTPRFGDAARGVVDRRPLEGSALLGACYVMPPGSIADAYSLDNYEVRGASRIGIAHAHAGEPRQDDYVITTADGGRYLVVVVCDGLGSAPQSHFGSHWTTRLLSESIDIITREKGKSHEPQDVGYMIARTEGMLRTQFDASFPGGQIDSISTTLVALVLPVDGSDGYAFRIGDSDLMFVSETGWQSVFGNPNEGPLADSTTAAFPSTNQAQYKAVRSGGRCIVLATDGVAGPMLASPDVVGAGFIQYTEQPISESDFSLLVGFERKAALDDRTAVAVWRK